MTDSRSPFYVKVGDTDPILQAQLFQGDGTVLDLTGATVTFTMSKRGSTNPPKVSLAACVVYDAANGKVSYSWQPADTDTKGTYDAEFRVTFADSSVERVPNYGYHTVIVSEKLA